MIMMKYALQVFTCVFIVLASCSSPKKQFVDNSIADTLTVAAPIVKEATEMNSPYYNTNFQLALFRDSITFYGFNAIGKWELKIDADKRLIFILDGEKTVFEYTKWEQTADPGVIRFYSKKILDTGLIKNNKNAITIILHDHAYLDPSTGVYVPFSVRIQLDDVEKSVIYSGGGFYVSEPTLNDIWVLDSMNTKKVDVAKFPQGLPQLEFQLAGGQVFGFSGCNQLSGSFYKIRNEIEFGTLAMTLMSCADLKGDSAVVAMLNKKRFAYSIQNGKLTFIHKDKSNMVFRKVD